MRRAARSSSCASRGWNARSSAARAPARSRSKSASGVYNEIQAGSYVFMDADYARNLDEAGAPVSTFRHALFVLATVMSAPHTEHRRAGCRPQGGGGRQRHADGLAAAGYPLRRRLRRARQAGGRQSETAAPKLGEKLRLVPGHCDPTVDRYDWYVGVRGRTGRMPVAGRCARRRCIRALSSC